MDRPESAANTRIWTMMLMSRREAAIEQWLCNGRAVCDYKMGAPITGRLDRRSVMRRFRVAFKTPAIRHPPFSRGDIDSSSLSLPHLGARFSLPRVNTATILRYSIWITFSCRSGWRILS